MLVASLSPLVEVYRYLLSTPAGTSKPRRVHAGAVAGRAMDTVHTTLDAALLDRMCVPPHVLRGVRAVGA